MGQTTPQSFSASASPSSSGRGEEKPSTRNLADDLAGVMRCGQRKHNPAAQLRTWTHGLPLPQLLHLQNKSRASPVHPARGTLQHLLKELQKLLMLKSSVL